MFAQACRNAITRKYRKRIYINSLLQQKADTLSRDKILFFLEFYLFILKMDFYSVFNIISVTFWREFKLTNHP